MKTAEEIATEIAKALQHIPLRQAEVADRVHTILDPVMRQIRYEWENLESLRANCLAIAKREAEIECRNLKAKLADADESLGRANRVNDQLRCELGEALRANRMPIGPVKFAATEDDEIHMNQGFIIAPPFTLNNYIAAHREILQLKTNQPVALTGKAGIGITGTLVCAGDITTDDGQTISGVIIETGKTELTERPLPLYRRVEIRETP